MKKILALALLLMSFGAMTLADGSKFRLADGGGLPPRKSVNFPVKPSPIRLADGGGLPPKGPHGSVKPPSFS